MMVGGSDDVVVAMVVDSVGGDGDGGTIIHCGTPHS